MQEFALTHVDLARLTGRSPTQVDAALDGFSVPPLRYRELTDDESARIAERVDAVIRDETLRRSGEDDPAVWNRGWGEVATQLKNRSITRDALRPQYFRGEPTCRLFGRYIRPLAPEFEYEAGLALRRIVFDEFLRDAKTIVEFGCGTGINLLLLSEQFPEARLTGTDWAPVCAEILGEIARQTGRRISGEVFNMLNATGWEGPTESGAALMTVHAMEQLGSNWQSFLDFLIARRPALCLHIEPILEHYDERSSFDARARRYHLKRGYLQGFLPEVLALCKEGKADLIGSRRVRFGGLYHEAYSILAWRPKA
jgi:cyclopropane fatty-acyl-phospholipid synthase-like methyltransferase